MRLLFRKAARLHLAPLLCRPLQRGKTGRRQRLSFAEERVPSGGGVCCHACPLRFSAVSLWRRFSCSARAFAMRARDANRQRTRTLSRGAAARLLTSCATRAGVSPARAPACGGHANRALHAFALKDGQHRATPVLRMVCSRLLCWPQSRQNSLLLVNSRQAHASCLPLPTGACCGLGKTLAPPMDRIAVLGHGARAWHLTTLRLVRAATLPGAWRRRAASRRAAQPPPQRPCRVQRGCWGDENKLGGLGDAAGDAFSRAAPVLA